MTGMHGCFFWRDNVAGERIAMENVWPGAANPFSSSLCVFWTGLDTLIWRFLGSNVTGNTVVTLGVM